MSETREGRCLCGACRFTADAEPEAGVCHCGMCRRWTGGINIAVACSNVTWNEGAPLKVYVSSEWGERVFCGDCGSNLFWRARHGDPSVQAIALMAFDDPEAFAITKQIFIDEKPKNYALANDTMTMTGAEVIAMFAPKDGG